MRVNNFWLCVAVYLFSRPSLLTLHQQKLNWRLTSKIRNPWALQVKLWGNAMQRFREEVYLIWTFAKQIKKVNRKTVCDACHLQWKKVIEWYFFNNQSIIPSTDVIQLTLTLKMTTAQVVETSDTVNNNSPIQDFVHPDDQTQPTFDITKGDINIFWNTDAFVCLRLLFFWRTV